MFGHKYEGKPFHILGPTAAEFLCIRATIDV